MAGNSGNSLPRKLGVGEGDTLLAWGIPADVDLHALLVPRPDGMRITTHVAEGTAVPLALAFVEDAVGLDETLASVLRYVARTGALWVAWPKKSSRRWKEGPRTIDDGVVRGAGLARGVVDVKVCAIDETWSGLKFVYRLTDR
ncbi:MAG: DUF3052 domain-containing protein [Actinomycetes bacterium]